MENGHPEGSAHEPASRIAARAIARAAAASSQTRAATAGNDENAARTSVAKARRKPALASKRRSPWHDLAWHLHLALDALQEDEYLIVSIRGTNRYVQFAAQGLIGMRAEATSSYYLPEPMTLDARQHRELLELGWRAPTNLPEGIGPHEPEGSPNYFVDIEPPVDYAWLAVLAVTTLAAVFGASDVRELQYKAFVADGTPIRFPTLGLAIERT